MDILFTLINFDAFKSKMVSAKKVMVNEETPSTSDGDGFQKVDIDSQYQLFQSNMSESLTDATIGWKKKVDQKVFKNGFKMTVH